jgi:hypothetical protein
VDWLDVLDSPDVVPQKLQDFPAFEVLRLLITSSSSGGSAATFYNAY